MLNALIDILFPQRTCCVCKKPGKYGTRRPWCDDCEKKMIEMCTCLPVCDKCGKYLQNEGVYCRDCDESWPAFDICRAVGPYTESSYRIAIKVLKFLGRKYFAHRMGIKMAQVVKCEPRYWPLDLIIPVPSTSTSLKNRGFNQTELLGRQISKVLKIKMDTSILIRIKDTPPQRELSREEREKNLYFAFQVRDKKKISQKNILLVDDIYTTGSTIRECTRVLMEAGAARVAVITWATGVGY